MINQLIQTLLWSSTDGNGNPLDSGDYIVSQELCDQLETDYQTFLRSLPESFIPDDHFTGSGDTAEQLAHDYIMTRNHHGVGFWDGDWGKEMGDLLTKLAQSKPEIEAYVGDDGLIYA